MTETLPAKAEELITGEPLVAHLGTCHDGKPHVAPLWYRYEDGVVEIMTTGRKLANVRENPRVALSIQQDEGGMPQWMVTLRGTATVVDDEERSREANRRLNRKYGVDEDSWSENTLVRIDVSSAAYRTYD
ncbi:pyridoxamine 5'-phosphate oxidase family protein (plasmid) [Halorarum halophilum]|uniref:Pyridoxamine 5'-phosphate oxidase family protein n=1 Tax=Halorarum halophilum TaxID=2743090 RepID=A0A7D5GP71_9EURY|nr:pyridoxamine 5'-phosphate oxidase family protein [Halobaculum halophilum]QLG29767.1 pyridoxamine 5'-phosphate oxidase family protein [Halobaculum halophilum]